MLHLGQARHLLGALGTLLLSAALRPPSPPSSPWPPSSPSPVCDEAARAQEAVCDEAARAQEAVCDEAARAQEACRCPSAQTHRDAPGRPRAAAACGNCGGGPAENRGQRDVRAGRYGDERVAEGASCPPDGVFAVSLWSEALSGSALSHGSPSGPRCASEPPRLQVCTRRRSQGPE